MKILVLGAGGIGGYYGGRLAEAGADVTFLVRERRKGQLDADGLRIRSRFGDADIPVKSATAARISPDHDIALLTCKAYDLPAAMEDVGRGLKETGAVLPLLNGLSHIGSLKERFGADRVLGGVAKIGVTLTPDGLVSHLGDSRQIIFGEIDGRASARVSELEAAFRGARGVEAEATAEIMRHLWEKFVSLGTLASMTALMRANVGEIVRTPDGRDLLASMLATAADAARHHGHAPSGAFMTQTAGSFADPDSTANSSLLRDLEGGKPTEADAITGAMLDAVRAAGLDDVLFRVAYTHLKAAEQRKARGQALQGARHADCPSPA